MKEGNEGILARACRQKERPYPSVLIGRLLYPCLYTCTIRTKKDVRDSRTSTHYTHAEDTGPA